MLRLLLLPLGVLLTLLSVQSHGDSSDSREPEAPWRRSAIHAGMFSLPSIQTEEEKKQPSLRIVYSDEDPIIVPDTE